MLLKAFQETVLSIWSIPTTCETHCWYSLEPDFTELDDRQLRAVLWEYIVWDSTYRTYNSEKLGADQVKPTYYLPMVRSFYQSLQAVLYATGQAPDSSYPVRWWWDSGKPLAVMSIRIYHIPKSCNQMTLAYCSLYCSSPCLLDIPLSLSLSIAYMVFLAFPV